MPLDYVVLRTPEDARLEFGAFLNSAEYHTWISKRDPQYGLTLWDVLEQWVTHGNATEVFPTFESFLLGVLELVASMETHENCAVDDGCYFWPDRLNEDGVLFAVSLDGFDGRTQEWRPVHQYPVMNRVNFEMHQAYRRHLRSGSNETP